VSKQGLLGITFLQRHLDRCPFWRWKHYSKERALHIPKGRDPIALQEFVWSHRASQISGSFLPPGWGQLKLLSVAKVGKFFSLLYQWRQNCYVNKQIGVVQCPKARVWASRKLFYQKTQRFLGATGKQIQNDLRFWRRKATEHPGWEDFPRVWSLAKRQKESRQKNLVPTWSFKS